MCAEDRSEHARHLGEDGAALIGVILLTAAMLALGVFGSRSAQIELRIANNEMLAKKALSAAEAGLNHAFNLIKNSGGESYDDELSGSGTGGSLTSIGSLQTLNGTNCRYAAFGGGATGDGYCVRVVDNYDERTGANNAARDEDARIRIVSLGRVSGAERVIEAYVDGMASFPSALFGKLYVTLTGGSQIDSFDSRDGPYVPANARRNANTRSNGDITLTGNGTTIFGSALSVTRVDPGTGTITGATMVPVPPWNPASVPSCGPPYYPSSAGITTIGNASYDPATGVLRSSGGGSILLANGTYCFRRIDLSGASTLRVDGPVRVYLTDASDLSGGSVLNTTALASNFLLFSSYVSAGDGVRLAGGAGAHLAVYAPDSGVRFTGGTDFFGAVVGGYLTNNGGTNFHYDESLGTIPGSGIQLIAWHEVRNG